MIIFIETLLHVFGFTLISLSLARHYGQVNKKRKQLSTRLLWVYRLSGYVLLLAGVVLAIYVWGIMLGLVYWLAYATLVTFLLSLILAFKPNYLSFLLLFKR